MSLSTLNLSAAILHYTLALLFAGWFGYLNYNNPDTPVNGVELSLRDHAVTIFVHRPPVCDAAFGPCDCSGNQLTGGWKSENTQTIDIKVLQGMLISFFLITGTFHLYYYLDENDANDKTKKGKFGGLYSEAIGASNNYFRWIEYSITSTLMLYIIAFTSGVKDTGVYMNLFATNIAMIYTGQLVEVAVRDGKNWVAPMILGFVLLLSEFAVIARSFWTRLDQVQKNLDKLNNDGYTGLTGNQSIPDWIKYMIIILFIFFSCFGFISLVGAISGARYESIEKAYLISSFAAKATLGFFIAYGLGQRVKGWGAPKTCQPTPTPTPTP